MKKNCIVFLLTVWIMIPNIYSAGLPKKPTPTIIKLLNSFEEVDRVNGKLFILFGIIKDTNGKPLSGISMEIWQTDNQGIYEHTRDYNYKHRDLKFQFYGSTVSDANGQYVFRTMLPGLYEPRPRHIHFKIKLGKRTLLTSQFYFIEGDTREKNLRSDWIFNSVRNKESILLPLETYALDNYKNIYATRGDIVIEHKSKGALSPTPSQPEGPYYPQQNVSLYDNDLLIRR